MEKAPKKYPSLKEVAPVTLILSLKYCLVVLKRTGCFGQMVRQSLTSESVQGASLPLQSVDDIHGGDGLPLGVFGVGDSVPDDVLEEHLEDTTGLLVDESGDTLDSATARQPPDGGLGDALDVVSQHLPVTLGASLAQSLASFATSGHVAGLSVTDDQSPGARAYITVTSQSQNTKTGARGRGTRRTVGKREIFSLFEFQSKYFCVFIYYLST